MVSEPPRAIKIFYCYAREDKALRDELEKHLSAMRRAGKVITWHDREIQPGTDWKREIDTHLQTSAIILLLISHHFMHSDYCYGVEMRQALERHKVGRARVIPIILSPVEWQETPIGELQALPTDGKAVTTWRNRNEAFREIVKGIRIVVETLLSLPSESAESRINNILILTEDAKVGNILLTIVRQNPIVLNATWISSVETVIEEVWTGFKYDTVYLDVRENWRQKKWFILMIRDRYPLVPFILVGSYEVFLSQLEAHDKQYFGEFYFFDIETPPHHVSALITELLIRSAWYLVSRRGEKYLKEKRYNIHLKEYQVQAPFLWDK